ncbi:hypothetical protein [Streptomyces sp. NPDC017868]|uniref:hypothetical protein n=1 Tax=Streptomyces sp. NPDC017868 TaxID=3365014 RepID=UPI0037A64402
MPRNISSSPMPTSAVIMTRAGTRETGWSERSGWFTPRTATTGIEIGTKRTQCRTGTR